MDDLLRDAAARAIRYRREIGNRPVWPVAAAVEALGRLDEALPATRQDDAGTGGSFFGGSRILLCRDYLGS